MSGDGARRFKSKCTVSPHEAFYSTPSAKAVSFQYINRRDSEESPIDKGNAPKPAAFPAQQLRRMLFSPRSPPLTKETSVSKAEALLTKDASEPEIETHNFSSPQSKQHQDDPGLRTNHRNKYSATPPRYRSPVIRVSKQLPKEPHPATPTLDSVPGYDGKFTQEQPTAYNAKQESNFENVLVAVRFRPEHVTETTNVWKLGHNTVEERSLEYSELDDETLQVAAMVDDRRGSFCFDHVFNPESSNDEVYSEFAERIVERALDGFNATLFAYGQTTAGKTHTILGTEDELGVLVMALQQVFEHVKNLQNEKKYIVRMCYLEIYQGSVIDLLCEQQDPLLRSPTDQSPPRRPSLNIVNHPVVGPFVRGAKSLVISSVEEAMELLAQGETNRHIGATAMNDSSSRSHTILQLRLESCTLTEEVMELTQNGAAQPLQDEPILLSKHVPTATVSVSTLNIIDLAGSERVSKSKAQGTRLQEAGYINKSLSTLGNVIASLNAGDSYVPFRNSKLTRLLSAALGGNSCTGAICCVSPRLAHRNETRSTLQFAQRISQITNFATLNKVTGNNNGRFASPVESDGLIRQFSSEIATLKQQLKFANGYKQSEYELRMQLRDVQGKLSWLQSKHFRSSRISRAQLLGFRTPGWKARTRSHRHLSVQGSAATLSPVPWETSESSKASLQRWQQMSPCIRSAIAKIHRLRRSATKPPLASVGLRTKRINDGDANKPHEYAGHSRSNSADTSVSCPDDLWERKIVPLNLASVVEDASSSPVREHAGTVVRGTKTEAEAYSELPHNDVVDCISKQSAIAKRRVLSQLVSTYQAAAIPEKEHKYQSVIRHLSTTVAKKNGQIDKLRKANEELRGMLQTVLGAIDKPNYSPSVNSKTDENAQLLNHLTTLKAVRNNVEKLSSFLK